MALESGGIRSATGSIGKNGQWDKIEMKRGSDEDDSKTFLKVYLLKCNMNLLCSVSDMVANSQQGITNAKKDDKDSGKKDSLISDAAGLNKATKATRRLFSSLSGEIHKRDLSLGKMTVKALRTLYKVGRYISAYFCEN